MPFRLLSGPIVRRVEPRSVSIWVALDAAANVEVSIWSDLQTHGVAPDPEFQASEDTLRIGDKLHLALVTVSIPDNEPPFLPERAYSYNVSFEVAGEPKADLSSLNLLQGQFALGYEPEALPSFVLPPEKLTDLRLLNGSCRAPHPDFPDGLRWVDDLIRENRTNPVTRPHQLFLTGDQIYADSVDIHILHLLISLAKELIGQTELIPTRIQLQPEAPVSHLPCDADHFPPGLRGNVSERVANFTSGESGQLFSFGEYCAMYLLSWSDVLWPETIPEIATIIPDRPVLPHDIWQFHTGLGMGDERLIPKVCQKRQHGNSFTLAAVNELLGCIRNKNREKTRRALTEFRSGLPKVRRALANVATYMMLDDHEITDDLSLTEAWIDQVRSSQLGRTILRNGMLAYMLFQGWGNDPKIFLSDILDEQGNLQPSPHKQLLDLATKLFPAGDENPPDVAAMDAIDELFGLGDQVDPETHDRKDRMTWHYSVTGPHHIVFVLDTRTQRRFATRLSPPGNVSDKGLRVQIPEGPRPEGIDVVFVISTLPVLGPPIFDALFAPFAFRIADFAEHLQNIKEGDRPRMPGTDPDAIEAWAFDDHAFENLLQRLESYRRVIFISGDVHYATGAELSYWKKGEDTPARFVQFTGSALRKDFAKEALMASQNFAFMQHLIRAGVGTERIAWKKKDPEPLSIPDGKKPVPPLRERLRNEPVLLPTVGWPDGTEEKESVPPDWAWRMLVLSDERPDAQRPEASRAEALFSDDPNRDIQLDIDGYRTVAIRHNNQLNKLNHSRLITWATNLGLVRFETSDTDGLIAVHDLYSVHPKAPVPEKAEVYMQHRAALDADPNEERPRIPHNG